MENKFECGNELYLPVTVCAVCNEEIVYDYDVFYLDRYTGEQRIISVIEEQLLTAQEIADQCGKDPIDWQATYNEYSEKAQRTIAGLSKRITELDETIKAFSESENIVRTNFDAKVDENRELKARNAELEALLKEVMATRDEAIKQNNELIAENKKLKAENGAWQIAAQTCADNAKVADKATEELRKENKELRTKVAENADTISRLSANKVALTEEVGRLRETIADRTIDVQHLTEENDKLKTDLEQRNKDFWAMKKDRDELDSIGGKLRAENDNLKEWYDEANKTASEAAEANDELKAKIADLRNRVGEQLAQIQDLNAEVHFHKEFGEGLDKQQKELQARYDELDSVNHEQAEKIRKLDAERDTWERNAKAWKMTADGMSKRAEELQAENEKLNNRNKYLESEKNRKPIVHVLTNDGHVYAFTSSGKVSVKYHTELNILMIEDGEKTIAGFSRGDKPGNLSAWWMG